MKGSIHALPDLVMTVSLSNFTAFGSFLFAAQAVRPFSDLMFWVT
jgi:hypothetical protein